MLYWISCGAIFMLIILAIIVSWNMINKLRISFQFFVAIQCQRCILCSAEILKIRTSANSRGSIKIATAKYTVNGKPIIGSIICTYGGPIPIRQQQRVKAIVNPDNLNLYAFSEDHVKDALLTYSVFSLLACVALIGLIICAFKYVV